MNENRFEAVTLSFNIGIPETLKPAECNPGGSVICDPGTGGCGGAGMTCVGNSCSGSSATREFSFESRINVANEKLASLHKELTELVKKFTH